MNYQLELKQIVDFPRCRIYREFIQTLMKDRSIRTNGGSCLFYFLILCSYANYSSSYRNIEHLIKVVMGVLTSCDKLVMSCLFASNSMLLSSILFSYLYNIEFTLNPT